MSEQDSKDKNILSNYDKEQSKMVSSSLENNLSINLLTNK